MRRVPDRHRFSGGSLGGFINGVGHAAFARPFFPHTPKNLHSVEGSIALALQPSPLPSNNNKNPPTFPQLCQVGTFLLAASTTLSAATLHWDAWLL